MSFTCLHRVLVPTDCLDTLRPHLERTEDRVWLSKRESCLRYTLRGVPARIIDVCITELPLDGRDFSHLQVRPPLGLCLEIGRKTGKYDGAERWELNLRRWFLSSKVWEDGVERRPVGKGRLQFLATEPDGSGFGNYELSATWTEDHQSGRKTCHSWFQEFARLRSNLGTYNLAAIVMWHYRRYYMHLPFEEVRLLADSFEHAHPEIRSLTLAEANRLASRDLYRLSRQLGWRKLTSRDRSKLHLDAWWAREDFIAQRLADMGYREGTPTGAGQYTHEAAAGFRMYPIVEGKEGMPGDVLHDLMIDGVDPTEYIGGDPEV